MIILYVRNPKSNLSKEIDASRYGQEDLHKTFAVYMKAGYEISVKEGIEQIIVRGGLV